MGKELRITLLMVVVALAFAGLAYAFFPETAPNQLDAIVGQPLFSEYSVSKVRQAEVRHVDRLAQTSDTLTVKLNRDKQWLLRQHSDYVANSQSQIAAVTNLAGQLTVLEVTTDDEQRHQEFGVIDPDAVKTSAALAGAGSKITLTDRSNKILASLIIGNAEKNAGQSGAASGRYFVRIAGQAPVYLVELDPRVMSTRFADWVNADFVGINAGREIPKLSLEHYLLEPSAFESGGEKSELKPDYLVTISGASPVAKVLAGVRFDRASESSEDAGDDGRSDTDDPETDDPETDDPETDDPGTGDQDGKVEEDSGREGDDDVEADYRVRNLEPGTLLPANAIEGLKRLPVIGTVAKPNESEASFLNVATEPLDSKAVNELKKLGFRLRPDVTGGESTSRRVDFAQDFFWLESAAGNFQVHSAGGVDFVFAIGGIAPVKNGSNLTRFVLTLATVDKSRLPENPAPLTDEQKADESLVRQFTKKQKAYEEKFLAASKIADTYNRNHANWVYLFDEPACDAFFPPREKLAAEKEGQN